MQARMRSVEYLVVNSLVDNYDFHKPYWDGEFGRTKFTPSPAGMIVHHNVWNWELQRSSGRSLKHGRLRTEQIQRIIKVLHRIAGDNDYDTDKELIRTTERT